MLKLAGEAAQSDWHSVQLNFNAVRLSHVSCRAPPSSLDLQYTNVNVGHNQPSAPSYHSNINLQSQFLDAEASHSFIAHLTQWFIQTIAAFLLPDTMHWSIPLSCTVLQTIQACHHFLVDIGVYSKWIQWQCFDINNRMQTCFDQEILIYQSLQLSGHSKCWEKSITPHLTGGRPCSFQRNVQTIYIFTVRRMEKNSLEIWKSFISSPETEECFVFLFRRMQRGGDVFENVTVTELCVSSTDSLPHYRKYLNLCLLSSCPSSCPSPPYFKGKSLAAPLISAVFSILSDSSSNIILQIAFGKLTVSSCQQKYVFTLTKFKTNKKMIVLCFLDSRARLANLESVGI